MKRLGIILLVSLLLVGCGGNVKTEKKPLSNSPEEGYFPGYISADSLFIEAEFELWASSHYDETRFLVTLYQDPLNRLYCRTDFDTLTEMVPYTEGSSIYYFSRPNGEGYAYDRRRGHLMFYQEPDSVYKNLFYSINSLEFSYRRVL